MDKEMHIVFKKCKLGRGTWYDFYQIFVTESGGSIRLEDGKLSFVKGITGKVRDDDMQELYTCQDYELTLAVNIDDNFDSDTYFSIVIESEQLEKLLKDFKLKAGNDEDALIALLTAVYKMCDSIDTLQLDELSDGFIFAHIDFLKNKDDVQSRSIDFIRNVLNISTPQNTKQENDRLVREMLSFISEVSKQLYSKVDSTVGSTDVDMDVKKIISEIEEKVIAQDATVESVVNNIYTNQKIINSRDNDLIKSAKVNILLDGPTGTGKTLILELVADKLSLPIVVRPVTSFSTVGYKGANLTDILINLLINANDNLELAERGIVVLDEFDKLSKNSASLEMRDALQQELLSYLSGSKVFLEYNDRKILFDTSKVTFIGLGAFNDLREKKIAAAKHSSIGFDTNEAKNDERTYEITIKDYIDEGLQRELVGRFSLICSTSFLDKDDLVQILKESKLSPLKSLVKIGKLYGVEIVYDDTILERIAELAYEDGNGARGLQVIVNNLKDLILSDLISGQIDKIEITTELLDKSRGFMLRSY